MQKQELISEFKKEMRKLNLTFFAPTHPEQFRVELGIVCDRGGHVYANFLNDIQTKQDLDKFMELIKSELKAMEELRARISEGDFDEEAYALEQYG